MERIEPSLETGINQAISHKHDDDSITAAIITAASDADRDHVRDLFETQECWSRRSTFQAASPRYVGLTCNMKATRALAAAEE